MTEQDTERIELDDQGRPKDKSGGAVERPVCHGEKYSRHSPTVMYLSTERVAGNEMEVWYCSTCRRMVNFCV